MVQIDTDAARSPKSLTKVTGTGGIYEARLSVETAAKGRAASLAARLARKQSTLRKSFLDAPHWRELARTYGIRLPPWGMPIMTAAIRRWLRKLGLTTDWYREWQGELKLDAFANRNLTWPLRAWVGVMLEERESTDYWAAKAMMPENGGEARTPVPDGHGDNPDAGYAASMGDLCSLL